MNNNTTLISIVCDIYSHCKRRLRGGCPTDDTDKIPCKEWDKVKKIRKFYKLYLYLE